MTDFASPLQRAAMAAGRPPIGLPQQQPPGGLDARIQQREQQLDALSPQIDALLEQQAKGYEGAQQNESALKDLLLQTQQRLGNLQYAPSPQEQLGRAAAAATSGATYKGGLGSEMGRAAGAMADTSAEARQGAIAREQLMAKYGIDAQQADLMAKQFGIQAAQARLTPYMHRADTINSQLDRMTQTQGAQLLSAKKYDPEVQGQLAFYKAMEALRGQLAGIGGGGGGEFNPTQPDPQTQAYITYQEEFPKAAARMSPVQKAQWDQQNTKNLAAAKAMGIDFQQGNFAIANSNRKAFDQKYADQIRFNGNVAGHMETYDRLMQALQKAGFQENTPAYNAAIQWFGKQTGHPEITNLEGVQQFLGPEFAKVIVPSGATGKEREEREASVAAKLAPAQWAGLHSTLQEVLGTQMTGLESQYKSGLWFMPQKLLDQEWGAKMARPELQHLMQAHSGRPTPTANDIAYVQAHPEKAPAYKARFGVDPPGVSGGP